MKDRRSTPAGRPPRRASGSIQRGSTSGNAKNNYERYLTLARDAAHRGDAVASENFYQHAEHYFRQMREN